MTDELPQKSSATDGAQRPKIRSDVARTVFKLALVSLFVGATLAFLGVSPIGFWRGVFDAIKNLLMTLGDSIGEIALTLASYLIVGALIVVPVWAVIKLLSNRAPPRR